MGSWRSEGSKLVQKGVNDRKGEKKEKWWWEGKGEK